MKLYTILEEDQEITIDEYNLLKKIQESFELTNEDINFEDKIRPYLYVILIKSTGSLPILKSPGIEGSKIVLQQNEYGGGSQGISFQISKGVRYRVGTHRGSIIRDEALVETSRGLFIITNQRILLMPYMGSKPISLPLKKILSYQCYSDCLLICKEGREKGYYFFSNKSGWIEIAGICISHLLQNCYELKSYALDN